MPFKKGRAKTGGKVIGSKNRYYSTFSKTLEQKCDEMGVDVFKLLLQYLTEPCPMELRLQAIGLAMKYLYPTKKSIEHTGSIDLALLQQVKQFMSLPREQIAKVLHQEISAIPAEIVKAENE